MRHARPMSMSRFMLAGRTLSLLMTPTTFRTCIVRYGAWCGSLNSLKVDAFRGAPRSIQAKRATSTFFINKSSLGVTKKWMQFIFERSALSSSSNDGYYHRAPFWDRSVSLSLSEPPKDLKPWPLAIESLSSRATSGDSRTERGAHNGSARLSSASTNGTRSAPSPTQRSRQAGGAVGGSSGAGAAWGERVVTAGGMGRTAPQGQDNARQGPGSKTTIIRALIKGCSSYGRNGGQPTRGGLHDNASARPQRLGQIPEDQLRVSFSRSSGAGGQNVNKLSTKVEIRFVVEEAEWLPHDVRVRLARHQSGRINSRGELVVTSQEFRTQRQNRHAAMQKLREMIDEAWEPAKERKMRTGISKAGKEMRLAEKHRRAKVKSGRSKVSSKDFFD